MKPECLERFMTEGNCYECHPILCEYGIDSYAELRNGFEKMNKEIKRYQDYDSFASYYEWKQSVKTVMEELALGVQ